MGWRGLKNGELLDRAEAERFDLLITADKNLRYQQNLARRVIAILGTLTNHRPTLERAFDRIRAAAEAAEAGEYAILDEET